LALARLGRADAPGASPAAGFNFNYSDGPPGSDIVNQFFIAAAGAHRQRGHEASFRQDLRLLVDGAIPPELGDDAGVQRADARTRGGRQRAAKAIWVPMAMLAWRAK
jgi:hypothetical protein